MMLNRDLVEQFIAVSYLYFLTTGKDSAELSSREVEELLVAINDNHERLTGSSLLSA